MRIERFGLAVDLPPGWEGRIYRRPAHQPGATTHPILHAGTVPLPEERGDFGSGVVERLGPEDAFVGLVEYHPEAVGAALFARRGIPSLGPQSFHPNRLQRHLPGQSGAQAFFSHRDRAFCLYAVLGDHARRNALVGRVRSLVGGLEIRPNPG